MSLYQVQKLLFQVNRDREVRGRLLAEPETLVGEYGLTDDERRAILEADFHALYRMGCTRFSWRRSRRPRAELPDYLAILRGTKP